MGQARVAVHEHERVPALRRDPEEFPRARAAVSKKRRLAADDGNNAAAAALALALAAALALVRMRLDLKRADEQRAVLALAVADALLVE